MVTSHTPEGTKTARQACCSVAAFSGKKYEGNGHEDLEVKIAGSGPSEGDSRRCQASSS